MIIRRILGLIILLTALAILGGSIYAAITVGVVFLLLDSTRKEAAA